MGFFIDFWVIVACGGPFATGEVPAGKPAAHVNKMRSGYKKPAALVKIKNVLGRVQRDACKEQATYWFICSFW